MRDSRGFAPFIIVIVLAALIGVGAVTFTIVKKPGLVTREGVESAIQKDAGREDADKQNSASPSALFGLWREEKRFGYDTDTNTWKEMRPPTPGTPLHYDFKENGTTCSAYSINNEYECFNGDPYTVDGEIVRIERPGLTVTVGGAQVSSTETYQWKIVDGKLELTTQGPFKIKYIAQSVPYPPQKSKAITTPTSPSGLGRTPGKLSPPTQPPPQEALSGVPQEPVVIQPPPPPITSPIVGVWKIEKRDFYYSDENKWYADAPENLTYYKIGRDGVLCTGVPAELEFECDGKILTYALSGNTMVFPGSESSRIQWRFEGEKLELESEIFRQNVWLPHSRNTLQRSQ